MEKLVYESPIALQEQVAALAAGTNPVVYFPSGTEKVPLLPKGARSISVEEFCDGDGLYYFSPKYTNAMVILRAVQAGTWWKVLGFVQNKEEVAKGTPGLVVARNARGNEIKSGAVDIHNTEAILTQAKILSIQFPQANITLEGLDGVLLERLMFGLLAREAVFKD